MEVVSIERSTYEELLTSFYSFVLQMKAMVGRGTDKRLGVFGLRIRNLTPSPILQILRYPHFRTSTFFHLKVEVWRSLTSRVWRCNAICYKLLNALDFAASLVEDYKLLGYILL